MADHEKTPKEERGLLIASEFLEELLKALQESIKKKTTDNQ